MAILCERTHIVWLYTETKFVIKLQRNFHRAYNKDRTLRKTIKKRRQESWNKIRRPTKAKVISNRMLDCIADDKTFYRT
ncbi:hypothetical protein ANN_01343 [Periplaneta americana]|uniref:DUF4817 domain-containing protein n=1 Tax=Periplaneta americana TaxID=6978 RepID=A0ABQ8TTA3_PERAM|nr:hypothetical protein ANN_01343 [Periplaneta americana]